MSNTRWGIVLQIALLSSIFTIACTPRKTSSESDIATATESETPVPVGPQLEQEYSSQNGWIVPTPKVKRAGQRTLSLHTIGGHEVVVTLESLLPTQPYFFSYGQVSDVERTGLPRYELKLIELRPLRVGSKIFAYVIAVEHPESTTEPNSNNEHHHIVFYKILDSDGDGKFETLFPGTFDRGVPDWVLS